MDSAGYDGITITHSITLDGGPYFATSHLPFSNSIVINITDFANDPNATVILRNLKIAGYADGTTGIRILSAKRVIIENCKIYNFRNGVGRGIDINTIVPNLSVSIINSTISGNSAQGIYSHSGAASPVTLAIEDTRIVQNDSSAIDLHAMTKATVVRCALNQNGSAGIYAEVASTDADVANTSMEHNIIAVSAGSGASVRLFGS
ncbi:MAG: right-handed parallel beta-helix repeat-containing protein, partial [Acidobacteria bacterium]|nr:right-handed parallel beta-helix repeat-containing protein [Acidobacteriota bacterium]